jgi:hypothetical protein
MTATEDAPVCNGQDTLRLAASRIVEDCGVIHKPDRAWKVRHASHIATADVVNWHIVASLGNTACDAPDQEIWRLNPDVYQVNSEAESARL